MTDDITANFHRGDPLSTEANASLSQAVKVLAARRITTLVRLAGDTGLTCDELEKVTGWSHQTVSARVSELRKAGTLADSGKRRATRSGRSARVHVVAPVSAEVVGPGIHDPRIDDTR